jgi:pimeloyl-ACP methyl ester carboxylesterase
VQAPQAITLSKTTIAFREFGDPRGRPLFFFHGWPGSSVQAWLLDAAARRHGFRGFALDRPGIGGSPFLARRLIDWPPLVCELAKQLGIARFSILGISGGGPYALACAAACPESIVSVAVACGAPPIAELDDIRGLHPVYRFLLHLFHRSPDTVKLAFRCARPFMLWPDAMKFLPPLRIILPRPDAEAIADPEHFAGVFLCQREAFHSIDGLFADAQIYAEAWGFALDKIAVPVQFWHGRDDANFHFTLAEAMAARVPRATLKILENEGHFSVPINHADSIVAALAQFC